MYTCSGLKNMHSQFVYTCVQVSRTWLGTKLVHGLCTAFELLSAKRWCATVVVNMPKKVITLIITCCMLHVSSTGLISVCTFSKACTRTCLSVFSIPHKHVNFAPIHATNCVYASNVVTPRVHVFTSCLLLVHCSFTHLRLASVLAAVPLYFSRFSFEVVICIMNRFLNSHL